MITATPEISKQSEARGCVYSCLAAEDPRLAVEELLGDISEVNDPNILKVAEFALIKAPIIEGVSSYLDDPFEYPAGEETTSGEQLMIGVGTKTAEKAHDALETDPNLDLATEVNQRRAGVLAELGEDHESIDGIFPTVEKAAISAASSAGIISVAVAREFASTTGASQSMNRGQFIDAIKSSGELFRAFTKIHLQQVAPAHTAIDQHGLSIKDERAVHSINRDGIKTDSNGSVRLNVPLREWRHPDYGIIGNVKRRDIQIGCLLSFEPKLATRFYTHYVDLMERYDAWPADLQA